MTLAEELVCLTVMGFDLQAMHIDHVMPIMLQRYFVTHKLCNTCYSI